jgi:hypothetical protein
MSQRHGTAVWIDCCIDLHGMVVIVDLCIVITVLYIEVQIIINEYPLSQHSILYLY